MSTVLINGKSVKVKSSPDEGGSGIADDDRAVCRSLEERGEQRAGVPFRIGGDARLTTDAADCHLADIDGDPDARRCGRALRVDGAAKGHRGQHGATRGILGPLGAERREQSLRFQFLDPSAERVDLVDEHFERVMCVRDRLEEGDQSALPPRARR